MQYFAHYWRVKHPKYTLRKQRGAENAPAYCIMKRILAIPLFSLLLLAFVGCDSGIEGDSAQDLPSLISQLDSPGESLITSARSSFVAEFEPKVSGRLDDGIHWGFLISEETHTLQMGLAYGMIGDIVTGRQNPSMLKVQAPPACTLESGANLRAKRRFANCIANLHAHCDGAWTWTDDEGNTHANGQNMIANEQGNLELVDCAPPDEG